MYITDQIKVKKSTFLNPFLSLKVGYRHFLVVFCLISLKVNTRIKDKVKILPNAIITIPLKYNTFSVIFLPHLFFFVNFIRYWITLIPLLRKGRALAVKTLL